MMGKKVKETNMDKIDTLIGKNTKIVGTVETKGTIRFDGELDGDLIVEGNVIIGTEGKVVGNINCNSLVISGVVKGNVVSNQQLRIANTGQLFGDIEVKNIIVDESALFEGTCKMITESNKPLSKDEAKALKKEKNNK